MDPNANLASQLKVAEEILSRDPYDHDEDSKDIDLASYVVALDEWIRKGGFLPARWGNPPGGPWVELLQVAQDSLVEGRGDDMDRYTTPDQRRMAALVMELGKAMGWVK